MPKFRKNIPFHAIIYNPPKTNTHTHRMPSHHPILLPLRPRPSAKQCLTNHHHPEESKPLHSSRPQPLLGHRVRLSPVPSKRKQIVITILQNSPPKTNPPREVLSRPLKPALSPIQLRLGEEPVEQKDPTFYLPIELQANSNNKTNQNSLPPRV